MSRSISENEGRRNKIIACKVSEQERKILEEKAKAERRSINNYVITAALEKDSKNIEVY